MTMAMATYKQNKKKIKKRGGGGGKAWKFF